MTRYPVNDERLTPEGFPFPFLIGLRQGQSTNVFPHHHHFYEISFYVEGSAVEQVSGQAIAASRGTVVCKLPHRIHGTRAHAGQSYSKYNIMFDFDFLISSEMDAGLKRFFGFGPGSGSGGESNAHFHLDERQTAHMERLFQDILQDYDTDKIYRHSFIRAKLVEILVLLARSREQSAEAREGDGESSRNAETSSGRTMQAILYVNSHFLTDLSLGGLSRKFALSAPYLSTVIKKMTGMNFTDYVHELRIQHACSLLVSTEMRILDISEEAGYSSFKTFSRVFLRKKGVSPSKFRARRPDTSINNEIPR